MCGHLSDGQGIVAMSGQPVNSDKSFAFTDKEEGGVTWITV